MLDRIFDFPGLYRVKVTLIKIFMRPISALLIRNKFSEDEVILANVPDGSRVYEIGCGDGNGYRLFLRANRSISYTASDFNVHMVDHCRTAYPDAAWEYYSGGGYQHPDAAFDVCIIRHVLHHIPARSDIVKTVSEALRIANKVILLEPLQSEGALLSSVKSLYWRITDGGVNYMRLDQLRAVLDEAGAKITWDVATEPLRQAYAATLVRGVP